MDDEERRVMQVLEHLGTIREALDKLMADLSVGVPEVKAEWLFEQTDMLDAITKSVRGVIRQQVILNTTARMRPFIQQYIKERVVPEVQQRLRDDPTTQVLIEEGIKAVVGSMMTGERDEHSRPIRTIIEQRVIDWAAQQDYTALIEQYAKPLLASITQKAVVLAVDQDDLLRYFERRRDSLDYED